jgi:mono/diheme cytochrome c family protein
MLKSFLILATLLLCGPPILLASSQQPDTAPPAGAAGQANPVHPTPASLARAKGIYTYDCAMCHGADGGGKGDFKSDVALKDYRDPSALKGLTDAEIFAIINKGKGSMPPEEGRAKPDEIWNLVIYLRSLSKAQAVTTSQAAQ